MDLELYVTSCFVHHSLASWRSHVLDRQRLMSDSTGMPMYMFKPKCHELPLDPLCYLRGEPSRALGPGQGMGDLPTYQAGRQYCLLAGPVLAVPFFYGNHKV